MSLDPTRLALNVLNRVAGSDLPDKLGIRKAMEKLLFNATKVGFKFATTTARKFTGGGEQKNATRLQSPGQNTDLFDLNITEDQQIMRDTLQRFAAEIIRPNAHDADTAGTIPDAVNDAAKELGLAFYAVPEALGGVATENMVVSNMLIAEDLAYGDMGIALALLSPLHVANALTRWGTAQQQDRYLSTFAGEKPPAATFALNEPVALFDPTQLNTNAKRDGATFTLNGVKSVVPLAKEAELFLISAQTFEGPAIFIVEGGTPGLSVIEEGTMGLKPAGIAQLVLENVVISADNKLGDSSFDYQTFIDLGVLGWCAMAMGTCQAVLDYVIHYCNEREAFGEPISHRQAVAFIIANMAIEVDSMRMLAWNAACRAEQGKSFHREAYLTRVLAGEKAMQIGTDGVQLLGGHGFTKEHPVERWYRDLRATAICYGLQV